MVDYGIVLGCPRSGTTFLMGVLDTVPNTESVTGIIWPAGLCQIVNHPLPDEVRRAMITEFERSLVRYLDSGWYHSRAAALQKWFKAPTSLGDLIRASKGKRSLERLIYKEPFLSFCPDFVYEALPEAPIVHIYRDGRDCANSLVRSYDVLTDEKLTDLRSTEMRMGRKVDHRYVPWWVEEGGEDAFLAAAPYVRAIWMWKAMVERCHAFFSRPEVVESGRVLLLRYEDLMRDPLTYGLKVAGHFGMTFGPKTRKRLEQAHTRSIGKYKKRDRAEVEAAERLAGDALKLYGYV
ncbi:sulfotransferase family protein [Rhodocaloribacter sp.]